MGFNSLNALAQTMRWLAVACVLFLSGCADPGLEPAPELPLVVPDPITETRGVVINGYADGCEPTLIIGCGSQRRFRAPIEPYEAVRSAWFHLEAEPGFWTGDESSEIVWRVVVDAPQGSGGRRDALVEVRGGPKLSVELPDVDLPFGTGLAHELRARNSTTFLSGRAASITGAMEIEIDPTLRERMVRLPSSFEANGTTGTCMIVKPECTSWPHGTIFSQPFRGRVENLTVTVTWDGVPLATDRFTVYVGCREGRSYCDGVWDHHATGASPLVLDVPEPGFVGGPRTMEFSVAGSTIVVPQDYHLEASWVDVHLPDDRGGRQR